MSIAPSTAPGEVPDPAEHGGREGDQPDREARVVPDRWK